MVFSTRIVLVAAVMALCVVLARAQQQTADGSIVCLCRCCYLGDCTPLMNASWPVNTCTDCTNQMCQDYITSTSIRVKTARIFESLQSAVPQAAQSSLRVDVCEVISVLEAATCTASTGCKRTTDVKGECYNQNAPLIKYTIQSFAAISFIAVIFGFVKNHIPSLQELNNRYFNY